MANICRMPFWAIVIVLHYAGRVEVVNERCGGFVGAIGFVFEVVVEDWVGEVVARVEVFIDFLDFIHEEGTLAVGVAVGAETSYEGLGVY